MVGAVILICAAWLTIALMMSFLDEVTKNEVIRSSLWIQTYTVKGFVIRFLGVMLSLFIVPTLLVLVVDWRIKSSENPKEKEDDVSPNIQNASATYYIREKPN